MDKGSAIIETPKTRLTLDFTFSYASMLIIVLYCNCSTQNCAIYK